MAFLTSSDATEIILFFAGIAAAILLLVAVVVGLLVRVTRSD